MLHDFAALRDQLVSVEHFGAFRNAQHNLVSAMTAPQPVLVAEVTASAFAIARTPALLGRYLLESDEPESASPVVVIGYQAWQLRFGGDSNIVGRTIISGEFYAPWSASCRRVSSFRSIISFGFPFAKSR